LYKVKTAAKVLPELERDIRIKIKQLEDNADFVLEFKDNGNFFVLDDMEDLEEGMRIKVSISTQSQSNSSNSFFFSFTFSFIFKFNHDPK